MTLEIAADAPIIDPDTARRTADRILSGADYRDLERGDPWWQDVSDWVFDAIDGLIGALTTSGGRGLATLVVIAIFIALIGWFVWQLGRTRGASGATTRTPERPASIEFTQNLTAAEWLQQAGAAEAALDWTSAIRCRHRALVAQLVADGVIAPRTSATAGEIAAELGVARPAAGEAIRNATGLFNTAWYSDTDAGRVDRDRFVECAAEVGRAVDRELADVGQSP